MQKWNSHKTELSTEIRQVIQKYEGEIKCIAMQLEEEKEKANDFEGKLIDLQATYEEKLDLWQQQEQRLKQMLDQAQSHAKLMENASNAIKNGNLQGMETQLKEKIE